MERKFLVDQTNLLYWIFFNTRTAARVHLILNEIEVKKTLKWLSFVHYLRYVMDEKSGFLLFSERSSV